MSVDGGEEGHVGTGVAPSTVAGQCAWRRRGMDGEG